MSERPSLDEVLEETTEHSAVEAVSPEQHQRLKDAVFGATFAEVVASDRAYFVLGSYGDAEKERVALVRDLLDARDGACAFLMEDVPEAWEYWTTKFKVLAARADHVVCVAEHSDGGHVWESGNLDRDDRRERLHVLKREYVTTEREREAYDAMFADQLRVLDERFGQVYPWADVEELRERVAELP